VKTIEVYPVNWYLLENDKDGEENPFNPEKLLNYDACPSVDEATYLPSSKKRS